MHVSRIARVVAVAALVAGLGACSAAEDAGKAVDGAVAEAVDKAVDTPYEVTYEVTGTGVEVIVFGDGKGEATNPGTETVTKPTVPWKKNVTLRGVMASSLVPAGAPDASITCKILHKGKVLAENTGTGSATCIGTSPITG
ncbi:MmpS family transport accessory protein (plasmid) [Streptomyces sp. BI20]|uniref:MmpS family transport accessory protein n=1 Tax=Streptomyces sp. BI20 TaxID=3403460 RepID=UPI003C72C644